MNNKEEDITMNKNMINDHEDSNDDQSKSKYRGWKVMPFVIGNETFEKLGTIGTVSNLLVYLTTVFNMTSIEAATTLTIFSGTTNLATLAGAFLCDTYFGRFNTLCFGTIASFLGLVIIDLTAVIHKMHPSKCTATTSMGCRGPTAGQTAFLMAGFGLLIIGAGGIRPCNLAFGADQFDPKTESGKRGVNSFFNWYFFTFTFAKMVSLTLIVYVQSELSWAIGLGIPPILMFLSTVMFFVGTNMYVKVQASGSPMTSVARVFVVSVKKRSLRIPESPSEASLFAYMPPDSINSPLPYTRQFGFLNKAAIIRPEDEINKDGSPLEPWSLCSIQQVEEAKCLVRVMPVWLSGLIYHVAIVQQQTYVVFQALQSDRHLGSTNFEIPAASYIVFSMLTLTLFIPIYDRLVVPFLQRVRGKEGGVTLLQRIGIGIFVSIVLSILSGLVEANRRSRPIVRLDPKRGGISSMSASWLIPQMALTGIAEAFAAIGQVEFYYKQFPENMRSIAGSLFFCGLAGSSYLSGFLITVVHRTTRESKNGNWLPEDLNHGRLDYFYYMVAGIGAIDLVYFLVCAKWYKYKGSKEKFIELNQSFERQRV